MSNLPVSSRLKPPTSRIAKPPGARSEGIPVPRSSGLKPPTTIETPHKTQSGLKQPLMKRSVAAEPERAEKKASSLSTTGSSLATPRTKQSGSQSKLGKLGSQRAQETPVTKREGLTNNLKRTGSSGSSSSLNKEPVRPTLAREKTQESLKDVDTGILFKVGDRVLVAGTKAGVIEYLGETKFAKGYWAGVRLDEPTGKNDGCVAGVRYFDCEPLHGVFSKPNRLNKINIVPEKKNSVSDFKLEDSNVLKIGDMVIVGGSKLGTLRYLGPTEFAKGEWAGVELDEPLGKNDGAVAGTRYFTCRMNYGLFAPSAKVLKSKKLALPKKAAVQTPEASLASAAKSVFKRTTPLTSENLDAPVSSPRGEKPSVTDADVSPSPVESLHAALKKTPSNSKEVAALQSALEEREREIRKMLMERELEKAEKLKQLEDRTKQGQDNSLYEEVLKEKDDLIKSLKDGLEKAKKDKSGVQVKLDEEKKKYEDLQFMLEEEKITDDELKNHVRQDEDRIRELSEQTKERNKKIVELQKELREARSDCLSNEAKVLELTDELTQSKLKIQHLESNMATKGENAQQNAEQLEILLANANKDLDKSKTELNKRSIKINELENKLNEQLNRQQELENDAVRETKEKLAAAEANILSLNTKISELQNQLNQSKTTISHLENTVASTANAAQQKTQQLETVLADAYKQLAESSEEVNRKSQLVVDMENKINAQIARQKEIEKEVENLDNADKNLKLMKEAHRAEVEALKSKVSSLTDSITAMEKKQEGLIHNHRREMEILETSKSEEVQQLKDKISLTETEKRNAIKECQSLKSDKNKVMEEISKLQNDHSSVEVRKNAAVEKLQEMEKKCNDLSETKLKLATERNDAIQLCEEQDQQLEFLKREKESVLSERDLLRKEKEEMNKKIVSLETKVNNLHSESSMRQEELQERKESEIKNLKAQLDEAEKEKETTNDIVSILKDEKAFLEADVEHKASQIHNLQSEQHKLHSLSQELESQISRLKKKMHEDAESAEKKIGNLNNEIAILKDDLEEGKNLLKRKDEDIRTYKEQIEKIGSEGMPKSPMDGDILENASTLLFRLNEAESKMSALQTEKETADERVEFLNSVIVDLQNKNEKAQQTIALLEAGDESVLLHGLDSESDEELLTKPKYNMRKFCDICDVFDKHDTDECPLQESGDDSGGVKHYGDRNQERPYCGICEAFGHWSEDCDDEQTF